MTSLRFGHVGVSARNPLALERFYTKYFGFSRGRVYEPGPNQVVQIKSGPFAIEIFQATQNSPVPPASGAGPEYPGVRHFAFVVSNLDSKLKELGADAKITLGPLDMSQYVPGMRVCWIADPEGNIIELNQGYVDQDVPPPLEGGVESEMVASN
jgi:glyoxylase I family protein